MSQLRLNMISGCINRASVLSNLYDLINDEDYKGNNGLDYVKEEAKKKGFENNLDYDFSIAQSKYGEDIGQIVRYILNKCYTEDHYYNESRYDILEIDNNNLYLAIAYTS